MVISRVTQGSYMRKPGKCSMTGSSQRDLAFVHQDRERRGREGLGGRADLEQRVGSDRVRGIDALVAVAACERDLAVLDDRDGRTRHALLLHQCLDAGVESPGRRGSCQTTEGEQERGKDETHESLRKDQATAPGVLRPLTRRHTPSVSSGSTKVTRIIKASRR